MYLFIQIRISKWQCSSSPSFFHGNELAGDGGVVAVSKEKLFLIPPEGGIRGAWWFWRNVGVAGQRSEKQDFCLLYRRMHTMYAHHPHCLGPIHWICLTFLSSLFSCKHTHTPSHTSWSVQSLSLFSEWCLCVVQACSWAVYIHGESHLGGSQTVCLWPCLPLVT